MPSNEVDELFVTLKFREELGEAIDDIDDEVDDLERSFERGMGRAQAETEETGDEIDQLKQKVAGLRLQLRQLDGAEADVDVDTDRGGRGGRTRLPGELDEVAEFGGVLLSLSPQVQAALGGLVTAAAASSAALGAAGGLAAVATQLANELGREGLQAQVKATTAEFKRTGRDFASAFDDVITNQILPAGRGFAQVIRQSDEALASFTSTVIANLDQLPGVLGLAAGAVRGAASAGREDTSNASALSQGIGDVPGIRKTLSQLQDQIDRVRGKFRRGLIPKEEMLSQIVSFREEAFTNLQKLKQAVPGAFPPDLLDTFATKLRKVQQRLKEVQNTISLSKLKEIRQRTADAAEEPPGSAPGAAGLASFEIGGGRQGDGITSQLDQVRPRLRRLREEIKRTGAVMKRRLIGSLEQVNLAFADAIVSGENFGRAMNRVMKQVAKEVIATLTKIMALKIATAALSGGASAGASAFTDVVSPGTSGSQILSSGGPNISPSASAGPSAITQAGTARVQGGALTIPVETVSRATTRGTSRSARKGR